MYDKSQRALKIIDLKEKNDGIFHHFKCYYETVLLQKIECKPFVSLTGTYKMKKLDLQREGFDPVQIKDKLYYWNTSETYESLTEEIYNQILSGKIRL